MLNLPRTYKNKNGNFPQHEGKPKMSYSMHSSWIDDKYKPEVILSYIMDYWDYENGFEPYADFGNDVGSYIEHHAQGLDYKPTMIKQGDIEHIHNLVDFDEGCEYEREVVLDFGDFVMEGYIDRAKFYDLKKGQSVELVDFKTGNLSKCDKKYGKESDYSQTTLYAKALEDEGYKIRGNKTKVQVLGRKGFHMREDLYLSGEDEWFTHKYSSKIAEKAMEEMRKSAEEIADYYTYYQKTFLNGE